MMAWRVTKSAGTLAQAEIHDALPAAAQLAQEAVGDRVVNGAFLYYGVEVRHQLAHALATRKGHFAPRGGRISVGVADA